MHQTFYIDIDEEITSIVEKLKKAQAKEIVMVVPKRALLIQSIVNLRILKKEADELGSQLMIVTQDKLGKILIEKAGILVQQKMDNMAEEDIELKEDSNSVYQVPFKDDLHLPSEKEAKGKQRLDRIGSDKFFDEETFQKEIKKDFKKIKPTDLEKPNNKEREKLVNKELVVGIGSDIKKTQSGAINLRQGSNSSDFFPANTKQSSTFQKYEPTIAPNQDNNFSNQERDKIENFFHSKDDYLRIKKSKEDFKDLNLSSRAHKGFWIFGLICVLAVAGIAAYLFFPKATVNIIAKSKSKTIDSNLIGDANSEESDYEKGIIPAKIIEAEEELSQNFDSTGDASVSNQKARGTATIYNEYSSSSQELVATTRLLTEDGKLFRLINGVTVPGMSVENGENKPGSIDVQVVADEAGDGYNIGPSSFTIPGFKDSGSEKYNKFYAKSTESMTGGGAGGEKSRTITEQDVEKAKSSILPALDDAIRKKIEEAAGENMTVLDDAINKGEAVYKLSNSPGEVADSFKITAQTKATALAVDNKELKKMVAAEIAQAGDGKISIDNNSIILDFGKSDANFTTGIINIKFHAEGELEPDINLDQVKKDILGKNEDDLKVYLSTISDIESVEIEYYPTFINGRIPFRAKQVEVKLGE